MDFGPLLPAVALSNGTYSVGRLDLKPLADAEPIKAAQARINKARTEAARLREAAQRAAKREPDHSKMNVFQIVQHGTELLEQAVTAL